MKLKALLEDMAYKRLEGSLDVEVERLVFDSRKDCENALFVCISGTKVDAHTFIPQVVEKGAVAVVVERDVTVPDGITVLQVKDARQALALLSAAWFGHPTRKMKTIGFTGTKGKTTSTYMLKSILEAAGKKVGLVGTNGAVIAGEHFDTHNTTPESYELQEYFHRMVEAGCEYMIMEVSSQGLLMHRVDGISFDIGVFTNLSPDHIGPNEHRSFAEYRACKGQLFRRCRLGLANRDDENWEALTSGHTCRLLTFGRGEADFQATEILSQRDASFMGTEFTLTRKAPADVLESLGLSCGFAGADRFRVRVGIPGLFNVYNALGAASAALCLGVEPEAVQKGLQSVRVNGRMELVYISPRFSVIVDYAHNGVSTQSLLQTLQEYPHKRLVVVFGCGGNRDPHRRIEMGEVAGRMADLSIITADNSRWEKVEKIMGDIHKGLDPTGGASVDIPDRREAIRYSIENAQDGDVIAVIGKGHEDYQEVEGVRTHFLDREVIEEAIRDLGLQA